MTSPEEPYISRVTQIKLTSPELSGPNHLKNHKNHATSTSPELHQSDLTSPEWLNQTMHLPSYFNQTSHLPSDEIKPCVSRVTLIRPYIFRVWKPYNPDISQVWKPYQLDISKVWKPVSNKSIWLEQKIIPQRGEGYPLFRQIPKKNVFDFLLIWASL